MLIIRVGAGADQGLPRWLHERQLSTAGTTGAEREGREGGHVMTVGE